mmetsp:Transcript_9337/g.16085  ORF Transcript_9337/g.16085 Transcript_9337/m.16085 type:complete len:362 (-) Transcript_9337:548-1633(-)
MHACESKLDMTRQRKPQGERRLPATLTLTAATLRKLSNAALFIVLLLFALLALSGRFLTGSVQPALSAGSRLSGNGHAERLKLSIPVMTTTYSVQLSPDSEAHIRKTLKANILPGTNSTVIITVANAGMLEFTRNWIFSLHSQDVHNFVVFCLDLQILLGLEQFQSSLVYVPSTWLGTQNNGERPDPKSSSYGQELFRRIVVVKPSIVRRLLDWNFTILISDVDVVFLRPDFFSKMTDAMRRQSCDIAFQSDNWEDGVPRQNWILCAGLYMITPTDLMRKLLAVWTTLPQDQLALNNILRDDRVTYPDQKICSLSPFNFANGHTYADAVKLNRTIYTVHANWMVGKAAKKSFLRSIGAFYT